MGEDTLKDKMERYEQLSDEVTALTKERDQTIAAVGDQLAEAVATAVEEAGTAVETSDRSDDGHRFRLTARLDTAALVAKVTETLPDGFVVSHVNSDGTLSVEWTGTDRTPSKREHGAILKAIIAEELHTDDDGLIESVPTRGRVVSRAVELGLSESDAESRLDRLEMLNVVDIEAGQVYPDDEFSRY
jgi:hypothetical protein